MNFKTIIFIVAVTSSVFSASFGLIDGRKVLGSDKRQYSAICNAVIAVRMLKRQKADRFITSEQYVIRVESVLKSLQIKGVTVK